MVTIYGLRNCDTCRKARKTLESNGLNVEFRDVRDAPLGPELLSTFSDQFGDRLVNRHSTTWRGLTSEEKDGDHLELLARFPTLMKRPVLQNGNELVLGWDAAAQAAALSWA